MIKKELSEILRIKNTNDNKVFGGVLNTTCVALHGESSLIENESQGGRKIEKRAQYKR